MKFGLDDKVIQSIQQVFESDSKVDEVIIFGSRVKGNYREGSDIDLAVKGRDVSFQNMLSLHSKLDDINLPYDIDLIDYSAIKDEEIIEHIDRVGVAFYERWKEYQWGDIATLEYGKGLNNYANTKGKYPVYGTNGKIGTTDKYLCGIPGIIIGRKGAYRGVHYSSTPFYVIDTAFYLKPKLKEIDIKYAYYQLLTKDLNSMDSGSAIPSTSREDFYALEINLPPLQEQISISKLLTELDNKIDLLQRQNKTLEQLAETLFKQWFVEEASEDWEACQLGDIATFHNGKPRPKEVINGNVPIYGGNGILGFTDQSNYNGHLIVIGRVGAYCGSLYNIKGAIWLTDNALLAKPVEKYFHNYLFLLLKSLDLNSMAEGSSHPLITQTLLKSIEVQKPPVQKLKAFEVYTNGWNDKVEFNNNQINTLTQLRDTLLPKLMSGELRVKT